MDDSLRDFISAAQTLAENPENTLPQTVNRNLLTASAVKKTCIDGIEIIPASYEMKITAQQVRNLLDAFSDELIEYARTGKWSGWYVDFEIKPDTLLALRKLCTEDCAGMSLREIRQILGNASDGTVEMILKRLGYSLFGPIDSVVYEAYAIPKGSGKDLTPVLRQANDILKDAVAPLRESSLRHSLRKEKTGLVDTTIAIMRHSPQYECSTSDGADYFSLTWKELDGVQKRVERILWENRGKGLEKDEIEKEYLNRLRANHIDDKPKAILFKDSANIGGANGLWRWKEKDGVEVVKDCRPYICNYVVDKNAPVTLDEVVSYVRSLGVKLSLNSVKTYLCGCCRHRRKTDDYVLKDVNACSGRGDVTLILAEAIRKSGGALSIKELIDGTGVAYGRVSRCLKGHPEVFEEVAGESVKRGKTFRLNPSWDGKKPCGKNSANRTPAYYDVVRCATVQMLKAAPDKTLPMTELRSRLSGLIPDVICAKRSVLSKLMQRFDDFEVIGKANHRVSVRLSRATHAADYTKPAFSLAKDWPSLREQMSALASKYFFMPDSQAKKNADTMLDIMGSGRSVASDSYFHLMFEMLYGWFAGKLSDRDIEYTRNLLALNYEKFLRKYYESRNGYTLNAPAGLGNVVKALQSEGMLPAQRYGDWKSESLSHIVSARGAVAHPDKRDAKARIEQNIREFLRLYLFTASLA